MRKPSNRSASGRMTTTPFVTNSILRNGLWTVGADVGFSMQWEMAELALRATASGRDHTRRTRLVSISRCFNRLSGSDRNDHDNSNDHTEDPCGSIDRGVSCRCAHSSCRLPRRPRLRRRRLQPPLPKSRLPALRLSHRWPHQFRLLFQSDCTPSATGKPAPLQRPFSCLIPRFVELTSGGSSIEKLPLRTPMAVHNYGGVTADQGVCMRLA